jgi:quercetin dioxygenase-like cupin family protein
MISNRMTVSAARLCAIAITVLFSSGLYAVDFLAAAPKQTKVLFENDKVRVIEAHFKKGDKVPMHSHPDIVVYVIKGGKTRFTDESGKTTETESKDGSSIYRAATTHSHEHLTGGHVIVVEMKK